MVELLNLRVLVAGTHLQRRIALIQAGNTGLTALVGICSQITGLTTTAYYTGYCLDNVTLAPAGELDMTEIIPLKSESPKGYTLTLLTNGGAPTIKPITLTEGESIPAFDTPSLEGYELTGWAMDGEIVDLTAFRMPASDVTLTAVWSLLPSETRPPEAETETSTEDPADSVTQPSETPTQPDGRVTDTLPPAESEPPKKKGCRSALDLSALLLLVGAAALTVRKRRETED